MKTNYENHYVRERYDQNKYLNKHTFLRKFSLVNTLPPGDPSLRGSGTYFFIFVFLALAAFVMAVSSLPCHACCGKKGPSYQTQIAATAA